MIVENRDDYILSNADIELLPGAPEAIVAAQALGFTVAVVTNQSPVGRGLISARQVTAIHHEILRRLHAHGAGVAVSAICPHAPAHGCDCRKPRPGLLQAVAAVRPVDAATSWMIGDAISDMQCARDFGVKSILVESGRGLRQLRDYSEPRFFDVAPDLPAAIGLIESHTVGRE